VLRSPEQPDRIYRRSVVQEQQTSIWSVLMGFMCAYIVVVGFFRVVNMKRDGTTARPLFFALINMHIGCAIVVRF
jgi:amino acid permease